MLSDNTQRSMIYTRYIIIDTKDKDNQNQHHHHRRRRQSIVTCHTVEIYL